MRPCWRRPGTSRQVTTSTTPGCSRARVVSIRRTTARGWSAKRSAPWSMPGRTRSATNGSSPSASSAAVVAGQPAAQPLGRTLVLGGCRWRVAPPGPGRQLDRVDDLDVAGAATEVAGEGARDRLAGRGGVPAEERLGLHHDARRAEPALRGAGGARTRRPRCRGRRSAGPRASSTSRPATRAAGWAHDTTGRPSTMTVHAPHEPSGAQPSFIERSPSPIRRTSRRLVSGRASTVTFRPLSVNSIGAVLPDAGGHLALP